MQPGQEKYAAKELRKTSIVRLNDSPFSDRSELTTALGEKKQGTEDPFFTRPPQGHVIKNTDARPPVRIDDGGGVPRGPALRFCDRQSQGGRRIRLSGL